ncbi:hypothetical protein GGE33_005329 [Rhizobium cellulosilyticum]|uniref:Uncharacterized protein n=1 Tax=Aliirhizobium cellulosilyticum TaxID=393664 RepID=A0A7W6SD47_9HYPH|nr:hypothetical protein [Rhizobium cellulosilyticum]MBB4414799.1 hypothetical protein [Rhizobium cellulosilyticum]
MPETCTSSQYIRSGANKDSQLGEAANKNQQHQNIHSKK